MHLPHADARGLPKTTLNGGLMLTVLFEEPLLLAQFQWMALHDSEKAELDGDSY
jgi:hypothetical protein